MKQLIGLILILGFGLMIELSGCKKCQDPTNSDCENYNPCYVYQNQGILSYQYIAPWGVDTLFRSDTIYTQGSMVLKLKQTKDVDSVRWRIGAEQRYRTSKVATVDFSQWFDDNAFKVQAIIFYSPNSSCASFKRVDTLNKNLVMQDRVNPEVSARWVGRYKGYTTDAPSDEFIITLDSTRYRLVVGTYGIKFGIKNLPKGMCFPVPSRPFEDQWLDDFGAAILARNDFILGYPQGTSSRECPAPNGSGKLRDGVLTINFNYEENPSINRKRVYKTFIGKRI